MASSYWSSLLRLPASVARALLLRPHPIPVTAQAFCPGVQAPNGTYAREGYTGNVVGARYRIDADWDGYVVRVISDSNEIAADLRGPYYGWYR